MTRRFEQPANSVAENSAKSVRSRNKVLSFGSDVQAFESVVILLSDKKRVSSLPIGLKTSGSMNVMLLLVKYLGNEFNKTTSFPNKIWRLGRLFSRPAGNTSTGLWLILLSVNTRNKAKFKQLANQRKRRKNGNSIRCQQVKLHRSDIDMRSSPSTKTNRKSSIGRFWNASGWINVILFRSKSLKS